MTERSWLIPSTILTAGMIIFVYSAIPDPSVMRAAWSLLPYWMLAAGTFAGALGLFGIIKMMFAGVESPTATIARSLYYRRSKLTFIVLATLLAGTNMVMFMCVKPWLNVMVPFKADLWLAQIDRMLFFGRDPWTYLAWLNTEALAAFYHRGWFAMMIAALLVVLSQPASIRKSSIMLTYFLLWTLVGPLTHLILPAAGPIFYDRLGYGNLFSENIATPPTLEVADYLWTIYIGSGFGPGAGISAMPSLHIATTVWMIMAIRLLQPLLWIPFGIAGVLIFLLSISLGWHYAVDGLVGGVQALLVYLACEAILRHANPEENLTPVACPQQAQT